MKPFLQRVREVFAPEPASTRTLPGVRIQQRNFAAAAVNRLTFDLGTNGGSINTLLAGQLTTMRHRSRNLARNEPYFRRYLRLLQKNVIGPYGIGLKMRCVSSYDKKGKPIYDEKDNATIERAFADWSKPENCTVTGMLSRAKAEQLAEATQAIDGECLIRLIEGYDNAHGFAWQFIETDRLDESYSETLPNGNRVALGVEMNQWGKRVAYHIWKRDPNDWLNTGGVEQRRDRERIPAEQIIHLFDPIFTNQVRGIPEMFAAILRLNHLGAYEEAEVVAARIAAGKLGFIEEAPGAEEFTGDGEMADGTSVIDAEPGTFSTLPNGAKVHTFDPQHPNASFESFVRAMLRGVSCAADMSYHSLTGDLSAVNYSSARIGLLDERDGYMDRQQAKVDHLCNPSFQKWLFWALRKGTANLPAVKFDKFNAPSWRPRRWTWIDPAKEADAAETSIRLKLKSRQQIIEESDSTADPEETWSELEAEEARLGPIDPEPKPGPKSPEPSAE